MPALIVPPLWRAGWFWASGGLLLAVAIALAGRADGDNRPRSAPVDRLLQQLAIADRQWRVRAEPLPGGGTRYVYRRRPGEPALTLAQIKVLLRNPPTFAQERQQIANLHRALAALGVRLELSRPHKPGAAAEWDPGLRTVRIKPTVVGQGSAAFARVLNHEAIHVAQSCHGGGVGGAPQRLGLPLPLPARLQTVFQDPTYAGASAQERALEREAYAHQDQLDLGLILLSQHC